MLNTSRNINQNMNCRLLLIVLVSFLWVIPLSSCQNSVPIQFDETYPLVQEELSLEREFRYNVIGAYGKFSGTLESSLTFSEYMVLKTSASEKYVSSGDTIEISIEPVNAMSLIKIKGSLGGKIGYKIMAAEDTIPITVNEFTVSHAVSEQIGERTEVVMDEQILYSVTIPGFGLQLQILVKPVLEYTPRIKGVLFAEGPVVIQDDLAWINNKLRSTVKFIDTAPVEFRFSEPEFVLDDFKATIKVYLIVGTLTVGPYSVDVIELGDYEIKEEEIVLMDMEPDLYEIIQLMQETSHPDSLDYFELREDVEDILSKVTEIESELDSLSSQINYDLYPLITEVEAVQNQINELDIRISEIDAGFEDLEKEMNDAINSLNKKITSSKSLNFYQNIGIALAIILIVIIVYFHFSS